MVSGRSIPLELRPVDLQKIRFQEREAKFASGSLGIFASGSPFDSWTHQSWLWEESWLWDAESKRI